jgi:hypothetical protein
MHDESEQLSFECKLIPVAYCILEIRVYSRDVGSFSNTFCGAPFGVWRMSLAAVAALPTRPIVSGL